MCLLYFLSLICKIFVTKFKGLYTRFPIKHWELYPVQCSEDLHMQFGIIIYHHSDGCSEQYEKQEESYDANEGC